MKELMLVRHGKSSWDYDVSDRDRPLKERGISDAHLVADALAGGFTPPDAVFSSPANRALHTCMILVRELDIPLKRVKVTESLYDFGGKGLRDFVHGLEESLQRVMLFGHNHAMTYTANAWGNRHIENVPTAGFVHLEFENMPWREVQYGKTRRLLFPKELK